MEPEGDLILRVHLQGDGVQQAELEGGTQRGELGLAGRQLGRGRNEPPMQRLQKFPRVRDPICRRLEICHKGQSVPSQLK